MSGGGLSPCLVCRMQSCRLAGPCACMESLVDDTTIMVYVDEDG